MSAELSGQVADVQQQLLFKVGLDTMSAHQATINQTISEISTSITTLESRVDKLQNLYANLAYNYNQHIIAFTGHTGVTAQSGHVGGLTGEI